MQGQGSVNVSGTGTVQDPYVVSLSAIDIEGALTVNDSTSVDLTLVGGGTVLDPYVLSAAVKVGADVTSVPTTGQTVTIDSGTNLEVVNPAGTLATLTIQFPATTISFLKEVTVLTTQTLTALTVSGAVGVTVAGAPTTLAADGFFKMRLVGTVWRRVA